jgi:tRNA G18 (ribose-2'-O)-methylase SpoU
MTSVFVVQRTSKRVNNNIIGRLTFSFYESITEDIARSWCCVMGNEGNGISSVVAKACSYTMRIDMVRGVDSLSVPIATGILLHGLKEREQTKITE